MGRLNAEAENCNRRLAAIFHVSGDTVLAILVLCPTEQDILHETKEQPGIRHEENGEAGLSVAGHAKTYITSQQYNHFAHRGRPILAVAETFTH